MTYHFLFGISGGEILILLLIVLLLFGPSKIPEIARMLGRGINEVKKVQREINTEIYRYSADVEKEARELKSTVDQTVAASNDEGKIKDSGSDNQQGQSEAKPEDQSEEDIPEVYRQGKTDNF